MFVKTISVLMVATLTLFAADAGKTPAALTPVSSTAKAPSAVANSATNQVNINTATADELQKLNGIGPAKAKAIVDYRKAHGQFKNPTDLINVPGIGDKIFAGIKGDVKVR
jgi:competence protein ComEA